MAQPIRYNNIILESYKKMFPDEKFINAKSPQEMNDHPKLDISELFIKEQITKYMCMIGQLQWVVTLHGMTSWHKSCLCPDSDLHPK